MRGLTPSQRAGFTKILRYRGRRAVSRRADVPLCRRTAVHQLAPTRRRDGWLG
jgi:hypothetical protein